MTRADKIRNMTDEELARFLQRNLDKCFKCGTMSTVYNAEEDCNGMCSDVLCWLKGEEKNN